MRNIYQQLLEEGKKGDGAVLVTRINTEGAEGAKGTEGIEKSVHSTAYFHDHEYRNASSIYEKNADAAGTADGGTIMEAFAQKQRIVVFGAGHIAVPLTEIASLLKFDVLVFDDRPSFANQARFPRAREILCDYFENAGQRIGIRKNDCVVIVTRGHTHDHQCLRMVLEGEMPRYLGMIGSRRRVGIIRGQLEEEGYGPEKLRRLHSPIGLDIGAVTPEEIALSILAEIVRENRKIPVDSDASTSPGRWKNCSLDEGLVTWLAGNDRENVAVVTVLATRGSTPREAGAKMVVRPDGGILGSIGGGCAEAKVMRRAREILHSGGYCLTTLDMTDSGEEDGMACGGIMDVLIESMHV
jgi:xanthine dehydrogenase accessory factor